MESIIFGLVDRENNLEAVTELEPVDGEIYRELLETIAYKQTKKRFDEYKD